jgi:hypothetical protein
MSTGKLGIYWASTDVWGEDKAIRLFLDKIRYQVEQETITLPSQVKGLFTDFRLFSIPGLPEWNFWLRISGYKYWTVAIMPVAMTGIVLTVVEPEYLRDKEYAEVIERIFEKQRAAINYFIKFSEFASVKPLLICLAYQPFQLPDEKFIGSIPADVPILKYNLQEDFNFVKDFRAVFGKTI